jgi:hypothetical protein
MDIYVVLETALKEAASEIKLLNGYGKNNHGITS